jgi:hypothetical protein
MRAHQPVFTPASQGNTQRFPDRPDTLFQGPGPNGNMICNQHRLSCIINHRPRRKSARPPVEIAPGDPIYILSPIPSPTKGFSCPYFARSTGFSNMMQQEGYY